MEEFSQKLGSCVICGDRVHTDERYLKSADGYCHHSCLVEAPITA